MTETMELKELPTLFQDIGQRVQEIDYEPVMIASLELLAEEEQRFFDAGADSNGSPWAKNAPATIKKKGHGIPLFETGALEKSLVDVGGPGNIHETSHRGLLFGTELPYSIFNQEGTSTIPARPHVGIRDEMIDAICDEVADFAVEALKE